MDNVEVIVSKEIKIPDIGTANKVDVIAVLIKVGDTIAVDTPLATLEGDKASMDIPSTEVGVVESVAIKVGDKVGEGAVICTLKQSSADAKTENKESTSATAPTSEKKSEKEVVVSPSKETPRALADDDNVSLVHASPAVRRLAHELDVNLSQVKGTGEKNRITKDDIKNYLSRGSAGHSGFSVLPQPIVDFAKFGAIETQALSKIKKISGANLHRNWVSIPHVTQFIEADTTELEKFRQANKEMAIKKGFKLTPLVFIMKAVVSALRKFPQFNASLDASGEQLILKKYFHIGVAVDTPNGLVVPVIRDVDKKGLFDLAKELETVSAKARDGKLTMPDMQGGCFSISSLGGIGGTAFTPIINAPEVAILGVSQSTQKPVYIKEHFVPRLMLPLSLSYDHRVIDGADGARFAVYLSQCLSDIRTLLL
ncbi:MAG: dihydrolipoyllysine-residue acetyltransferase [Gammaproteobacteria bacterium CG_4_10_14_0_8_um_filter_38_16]|nr:MAG: dihydrolipoyllysine-residue acetyltransferase [Gammaproteobacteria bacterium CG_4_10_14_0_8_um_filter_38_16]PJA03291.1 MAG: dihydrolipoyllysine-residue acetyltransferase [Gammaproteobacteria bacterium CG_4_10_14_0_2_um_filter_38_22]PJB10336.1 MAG: dihydrolipoyllysine-residue acetyltransferase [Gammaproteobacteria bacterium CG_4_9_14_3_um_filter_38_9]